MGKIEASFFNIIYRNIVNSFKRSTLKCKYVCMYNSRMKKKYLSY